MANGTLAASQIEMLTQSGTGIVTIVPPATNTNRTLTLPDSTGTLLNTNGGTITGNLTVSGITTLGNGAVLGVPASGTATNLTGLPISTGVSGLGTGIATALAVNVGTAGAPVVNGGALGSPNTVGTMPAFTLGGTVSGGGNNINNVVIGATSPLAGNFTTLSASSTLAVGASVTGALSQFESSSLKQIKITYPSIASYFLNTNASGNLTIDKDGSLLGTFSSTGLAVTGTLSATGQITASATSGGVTFASTGGQNVRVYGGSASHQWDIYGNGTNLRFSDNTGGGKVVIDTALDSGALSTTGTVTQTGANPSYYAKTNNSGIGSYFITNAAGTDYWRMYSEMGAAGEQNNFAIRDVAAGYNILTLASTGAAVTGALSATGNANFGNAGSSTYGGYATGGRIFSLAAAGGVIPAISASTDTFAASTAIRSYTKETANDTSYAFDIQTGNGTSVITQKLQLTWGANGLWNSTGLAVTGALSATGTLSGGTSGTGYSFSGSAPANSLTLASSGQIQGVLNNASVGNATSMQLTQNGAGDAAISFLIGATTEWLAGVDNSDSDSFKINNITGGGDFNNAGITLTTGGNLGIGTTSPAYRLEVATGTEASGQIAVANFRTASTTASYNSGIQIYATASATAASRQVVAVWDADGANSSGGDYFLIQKSGNSGATDILNYSNAAIRFGANYTNRVSYDMTLDTSGNLLVGTTDVAISASPSAGVSGGNFRSIRNTTTIPGLTTATVLTLSSSVSGVYIVQANFGPQSNEIYGGMLIVVANNGSFRIVTNGGGASSVLTLSGANVQMANAVGSTLDAYASAVLIAN